MIDSNLAQPEPQKSNDRVGSQLAGSHEGRSLPKLPSKASGLYAIMDRDEEPYRYLPKSKAKSG